MQNLIILLSTLAVILVLIALLAIIGKYLPKRLSLIQKNCWLIAHIMFVIVYFSGLFGTLLLANIATTTITDRELIYAAHIFSKYCDWFLIIPGAFGSLITGTWLSIRTQWGLTKYYWTIVKVLGNIGAILFGSTLMRIWFDQTVAFSSIGQMNPLQNPAYLHNRQMLIIGTMISLSILFFLVVVSCFKPWGKRLRS
ncbi:hypothetical protein [Desulfoscipio gibsoniae]|uniref:DUF2269 domain-containing protein n=1 Tax=Desulfoscipio gibsoniae DSM 7213 TaxID=767817 RepID=R4KJI6_9FIRM|nr:hypothetical protein [Desulfoscipio gibsoniae]AGL02789.1 hypothetical protein Desgi_3449 [Desulfoscipio gibsoniae DSM 7213]